MLDLISAC
uniref:Uncharacterized protein n=1 Tax=Arundo donax TaxID=35708 RepID=A0A0A8Z835_ARUDO